MDIHPTFGNVHVSHKLHNISDLECMFNVRSEFGNFFPSEYMYWDEARMQKSSANRFPKEDQVLIFWVVDLLHG